MTETTTAIATNSEAALEESKDQIIMELRQKNLAQTEKIRDLEIRGLGVYKENNLLKASPEIAHQMAQLEYDLKMAQHFVNAKTLPVRSAEEAYIRMQAGREMGLQPMEAIQTLYTVNGQLSAWGKGMVAILTRNGYEILFRDESTKGVTVIITKDDFYAEYRVDRATEDALRNSKAMGFAPKNKMRFHGIRQIIKFHLAHLFGSVSLEDQDDIEAAEKRAGDYDAPIRISEEQENTVLEQMKNCENVDDLILFYRSLDDAEKTSDVKSAFMKVKRAFLTKDTSNNGSGNK